VTDDRLDRIEDALAKLLERATAMPVRFFTVDGAAGYCNLSTKSIRRLIARGELTPYRPCKGRLLVDRAQLDAVVLSANKPVRCGRGIR